MKIVSIDIETTGLDSGICQTIEFGAVIENIDDQQPIDKLPTFHCYVIHPFYQGEPYALAMHEKIFKRIAAKEAGYKYLHPYELAVEFPKFLKTHIEDKCNVTGKNFATFDLDFLRADPYIKPITALFNHRVLDVGSLYFNPLLDKEKLPDTKTCLERAGMNPLVTHDAIGDARQIIELIRYKVNGCLQSPSK